MEDAFEHLARYYDPLMAHVNYDRWQAVAEALAPLLPQPFIHVDAACGTGALIKRLRRAGWRSMGFDLSPSMLRAGRKGRAALPAVTADLRALPFRNVDFITCLFDSLNFLLELDGLRQALREIADALRDGGLVYFDVVTERMVTEHFEDQRWTEKTGRLSSRWDSRYHRGSQVSETLVQVNRGPASAIRERMYPLEVVRTAAEDAGLEILGMFDATGWKKPTSKTVRADFVACKGDVRAYAKDFNKVAAHVRALPHK